MKQKLAELLTILMILSIAIVGCGSQSAIGCVSPAEEEISKKTELELGLGYAPWAYANANSHLVKNILEEKYDVTVNLRDMDVRSMWQGIATGDIDFMVSAFLPCTHALYLNEVADKAVDLGPLYKYARNGLVVPYYVEINSIDELNANADKFGNTIVGVDPGAGTMFKTIIAKSEYDIKDMNLTQGSDAAMTDKLKTAYDNGDWIVVTGWIPHWMFDKMDLKFLDDPKKIYCEEDSINVITRLGFAEDYPEINTFLDNYALDESQFNSLMNIMEEYDDDDEAAKVWIEENRKLVNSWFE